MRKGYKYKWYDEIGREHHFEVMFPIRSHKNASCGYDYFVHDDCVEISFYSYSTLVIIAIIYMDEIRKMYLTCTGTYSRTTIKHIGYFLKHFNCSINYYDIKNNLKDMIDNNKMISCSWCGYNPTQ